jgi:hypothetical protein
MNLDRYRSETIKPEQSKKSEKIRNIGKKLKNQKYQKKTEKSEKSERQKKIRKSFKIQKLSCHFRRSGNPGLHASENINGYKLFTMNIFLKHNNNFKKNRSLIK